MADQEPDPVTPGAGEDQLRRLADAVVGRRGACIVVKDGVCYASLALPEDLDGAVYTLAMLQVLVADACVRGIRELPPRHPGTKFEQIAGRVRQLSREIYSRADLNVVTIDAPGPAAPGAGA